MSLARGVIDRLCHNRAGIHSALARRLLLDHFSKQQSLPRYPVLLRFFSRSQPVKGLADAQKSIQKSADKFKRTEKPKSPGSENEMGFLEIGLFATLFVVVGTGTWTQMGGPDSWVFHWQSEDTRPPPPPPRKSFLRMVVEGDYKQTVQRQAGPITTTEHSMCLGMKLQLEKILLDELRKHCIPDKRCQRFFMADSLAPEVLGHVSNDTMESCMGLPYYMSFESREDVCLDKLFQKTPFVLFFGKKFPNWFRHSLDLEAVEKNLTQEEFEELKDTMVLSEAAKRFIIARKLRELLDREWHFVDLGVNIITATATLMTLHNLINNKLASKPMFAKCWAGLGVVGMGVFGAMSAWTLAENGMSTRINERLKEDGYSEGGIEYLEKQVRRGQLLTKAWTNSSSNNFFRVKIISEEGETQKPHFSSYQNLANTPSVQLDFFRSL